MAIRYNRKRKDRNHNEISELFEKYGYVVVDVSSISNLGFDIVVTNKNFTFFIEIKDGEKAPSDRYLEKSEMSAYYKYNEFFLVTDCLEDVTSIVSGRFGQKTVIEKTNEYYKRSIGKKK